MKCLKVDNSPGLVRDTTSNGIVNVDNTAYSLYKKNKLAAKAKIDKERLQETRINKLENEVSELKSDIKEILGILRNGNN